MKEVKVPVLPESINEATVAAWHKKPGDSVEVDDVIVEIETDKVVLEVPAEESGILTEILAEEGETVNELQVLGLLDDSADASNDDASNDDTPQDEQVAQEEPAKATQVSSEELQKKRSKKSQLLYLKFLEKSQPLSQFRHRLN